MDLNGAVVLLAALFALSAVRARDDAADVAGDARPARARSPARHVGARGSAAALRRSRPAWLLLARADRLRLPGRRRARQRRPGRLKPSLQALKPDLKKLNPLQGAKNLFGPHALFETAKNRSRSPPSARSSLLAADPASSTSSAALVGMPPAALLPELAPHGARHRPARRRRLPRDRARSTTPTSASSTRSSCGWTSRRSRRSTSSSAAARGPRSAAPPPDAGGPRAHDGRGPDRRRRRHQPDALRRRAALRRRQARARGRRQGPGPRRRSASARLAREDGVPSSPTRRSRARCTRRSRSATMIPEELFQAVAQLLAFVYRVAGAKAAA